MVTDVDRAGVSFDVIVDGQAAVSVHGQPVAPLPSCSADRCLTDDLGGLMRAARARL